MQYVQENAERASVLAALDRPFPPVKTTIAYRVGLVLVAIGMTLLPLLYAALVASLAWLVFWHASHNLEIVTGGHGGGKLRLFLYGSPIFAGGVAVAFLLKPFVARFAQPPADLVLSREQEPLLFDFVERLCRCLGAPVPSEIRVNNRVNASAGYRGGWGGVLRRELVLTVGMPLAAGLSLRQFSGVLAHEFGHFSQGGGMVLQYVIRSVNHWFVRVVEERDEWDAKLAAGIGNEGGPFFVGLALRCAQAMVFVSRWILAKLMWVGRALSGFLSQEMEYDADRYEAHMAGSDMFKLTARRLALLAQGEDWAHGDLDNLWQERRLTEDFAALVLAQLPQMQDQGGLMQTIHSRCEDRETSWLSSHPPDGLRIENAAREEAPGLFQVQGPTSLVFTDFTALSKRVTEHEYTTRFQLDYTAAQLERVEDTVEREDADANNAEAVSDYLAGWLPTRTLRPYPGVSLGGTQGDPGGAMATDGELSVGEWPMASANDIVAECEDLARSHHDAFVSVVRREVGAPESDDTPRTNLDAVSMLCAIQERLRGAQEAGAELVKRAQQRFCFDLTTACHVRLDMNQRSEVQRLSNALEGLRRIQEAVCTLAPRAHALSELQDMEEEHRKAPAWSERHHALRGGVRQGLWSICSELRDLEYPYGAIAGAVKMQDHLVPSIPDDGETCSSDYLYIVRRVLIREQSLYLRLLGDLARIAGANGTRIIAQTIPPALPN